MAINLALVTLRDGTDPAALKARLAERSVCAESVLIGETLKPNIAGGDLIWRLRFADRAAWQAAIPHLDLSGDPDAVHVDWTSFDPIGSGARRDAPPGGVYRQMTMHVDQSEPDTVDLFARETLGLPVHIPQILRWTLGRVFASGGDRPWTHVWEQEFASAADFSGPYMRHPWHWGLVDRWFDPEMPERIVDRRLGNSLCPLAGESVI